MTTQAISHRQEKQKHFNSIKTRDHHFDVPLDYTKPKGETIEIFAREVQHADSPENLPWMIFFQGGPGCESPRPTGAHGWIGEILKKHRLLLLDQRGTGLSSKVLPQTLEKLGTTESKTEYLTHFRADNIVRDAESIRHTFISMGKLDDKWTGLGQSYGGFCLLSYLSLYPEGLNGVLITGGVACIKRHIKENYRLTYQKVIDKNQLYYSRYPEDKTKVREIVEYLTKHNTTLPSGGSLSVRRFQQLGMFFGTSCGLETMHYLLENAFVVGLSGKELSHSFLRQIDQSTSFESNPIFCILHESIYSENYATNWAAEELRAEFPQFNEHADTFFFTGEMISPQMLDDYKELRPLKEVAHQLAVKTDWGPLYDLEKLATNTVPVAAISYYDDMYVPIEWSEETAKHVGNFRIWVTNEWEHNGIGVDGAKIMSKLLKLLHEPTPQGFRC